MVRLGVDLGGRRVGLAICDAEERIASPLGVLRLAREDDAAGEVARAAALHGAGEVVLGLPLSMDGRKGPKAREAEAVAGALRQAGLRVALFDERLSTAEAERALRAAGLRRRRRRDLVDALAAQRVLAAYLDSRGVAGGGRVSGEPGDATA